MRYYLYSISFGRESMTGLQAIDDIQEFSLVSITQSFKLKLSGIVLLFLRPLTGSEAAALYYERKDLAGTLDEKIYARMNLTMPESFNNFVGNCYLSGTDPRMDYSLL